MTELRVRQAARTMWPLAQLPLLETLLVDYLRWEETGAAEEPIVAMQQVMHTGGARVVVVEGSQGQYVVGRLRGERILPGLEAEHSAPALPGEQNPPALPGPQCDFEICEAADWAPLGAKGRKVLGASLPWPTSHDPRFCALGRTGELLANLTHHGNFWITPVATGTRPQVMSVKLSEVHSWFLPADNGDCVVWEPAPPTAYAQFRRVYRDSAFLLSTITGQCRCPFDLEVGCWDVRPHVAPESAWICVVFPWRADGERGLLPPLLIQLPCAPRADVEASAKTSAASPGARGAGVAPDYEVLAGWSYSKQDERLRLQGIPETSFLLALTTTELRAIDLDTGLCVPVPSPASTFSGERNFAFALAGRDSIIFDSGSLGGWCYRARLPRVLQVPPACDPRCACARAARAPPPAAS